MRNLARATVIAATSTAVLAGTTWAASAASFYGNPASAARYWQAQAGPDCVEETTRIAVDEAKHKQVVTESAIDTYATKIGLYVPGVGSDGGTAKWLSLFKHYGVTASAASMSRARMEADLAKGEIVIAVVNAETLWNPLGYVTANPTAGPDHALVVEAVNKSTGAVTLADGGIPTGNGEVVAWSLFSHAWAASGYTAVVAP